MSTNKTVFVIVADRSQKAFWDLLDGFHEIFKEDEFGILFVKASNQTTVERCISSNPAFVFISKSVENDLHFKNFYEIIKRRCPESNVSIFKTLGDIKYVYHQHKYSKQEVTK